MTISIAIYLALGYLGLLLIALFASNSIMFPAPPPSYGKGKPPQTGALTLPSGGEIAIMETAARNPRFHLIYCHGNGEDLGRVAPLVEQMAEKLECAVTAFDYPGYGASDGAPSEKSVKEAADAVFEHLLEQKIPENEIVVWGRSIGGGPAAYLAATRGIRALILESAFKSAFSVPLGVNPLPFDKFDNMAALDNIKCPILFIHGKKDGIIPFKHGEALFKKAEQPKRRIWFDDAGHNDIEYLHGEDIWKTAKDFIVDEKP